MEYPLNLQARYRLGDQYLPSARMYIKAGDELIGKSICANSQLPACERYMLAKMFVF